MKSFQSWVSERAGTIIDASIIDRKCMCGAPAPKELSNTPLQQRAVFADFLVPLVDNEDAVCDWVAAFCTVLMGQKGNTHIDECHLSDLLGPDRSALYYHSEGNRESLNWYHSLRIDIDKGVL